MGHDLRTPVAHIHGQTPVAETFAVFLRTLQDLQEIYGDDYEAIAIAVLVHRVTFADCVPGPDELRSLRRPRREAPAAVSRLKIAEALGIPRETVRRKVNELIALGVIEEVDHAQLVTARQHRSVVQELAVSMAQRIPTASSGKQGCG